jgi:hypothetical protein
MSVTTLLNFAVLPIFLLFGLFTLGYWFFIARKTFSVSWLWTVKMGTWFGVGLISLWVILAITAGLNPLDILRMTFTSHKELVQRDYLPWLLLHPYDVMLFVGFPVMALAGWGLWTALHRRQFTASDVLAIAMGLTFVLVDLAGIVQGENGRILSFYAPFLLLAGTRLFITRTTIENTCFAVDFPLFVAQSFSLLVMASVLAVIPLDLNPQPVAPRDDVASLGDLAFIPANAMFTSSVYAGSFQLAEYRYIGDPSAQAITFEFDWDGINRPERPYQFELIAHAYNDLDGDIQAEPFYWYPQSGNYLTTCWHDPDHIRDVVILRLPAISKPVVWDVQLRAVDERTGDVMTITPPSGESTTGLDLEPVKYP